MPVDSDTTTTGWGVDKPYTSGTKTSTDGKVDRPQRLRIHVPTADSEIVLGMNDDGHQGVRLRTTADVHRTAATKIPVAGTLTLSSDEHVVSHTAVSLGVDHRGFVGLLTTVDHGNVFVCAATMGGADLGSSYQHAGRVATIVETSINAVRAGLLWWGKTYTPNYSYTQGVLSTGQFLWAGFNALSSPLSAGTGGLGNFDYLKTGHVTVFGARSVKLESIEGVSSSAALFNSHSAGLSASLNSVVAASLNAGLLASLNAGYSASLNANDAGVIGGVSANLSSRVGTAKVEGSSIRIGNKRQAGLKAKALSGIQERTNDLWLRAAELIEIGLPSATQEPELPTDYPLDGHLVNLTKHPTGVHVVRGNVRVGADRASTTVRTADVTTLASKSVIKAAPSAIVLGRLKVAPMSVSTQALNTARVAYHTAWHTSEGLVNQVKSLGPKIKAAGITGAIAAVGTFAATAGAVTGVAAGLGAAAGKGDDEAGAGEGAKIGAIAGSVVGGVGAVTAMFMAALRTAGVAQRAGQRAAQVAYTTAVKAALAAEGVASTADPTANRVEITDSHVLLSFGPPGAGATVKLSSSGVEIKATKVTINDIDMAPPMVPAIPTPPVVPAPPEPEVVLPEVPVELVP